VPFADLPGVYLATSSIERYCYGGPEKKPVPPCGLIGFRDFDIRPRAEDLAILSYERFVAIALQESL